MRKVDVGKCCKVGMGRVEKGRERQNGGGGMGKGKAVCEGVGWGGVGWGGRMACWLERVG